MENNKYAKKLSWNLLVLLLTLAPFHALHAASVTYYLNDTNVAQFSGGLPDGTNYLTVKIDDEGSPGAINFTVSVVPGALSSTGINYGLQNFAFNFTNDLSFSLTTSNLVLSTGWALSAFNNSGIAKPTNADGYGKFDVSVGDGGQNRYDPLTFSITGISGDTISSYFGLSAPTAGQTQANVYFAAHVTGISTGAYTINGDSAQAQCTPGDLNCQQLTSAWFGGGPVAVVPVPGALWLFGSGLLGLVGVARSKKKKKETN